MRNAVLVFLFVAEAASAQLIGLPEAGVTLAGTYSAPIIVNNSDHRIVAYALVNDDRLGETHDMIRQLRNNPLAGIAPGATFDVVQAGPVAPQVRSVNGPPPAPIKVSLDSVVFENGVLVGPDKLHNFDAITARFQAQKDIKLAVEAGDWSKMQQIAAENLFAPAPGGWPPKPQEVYERAYRLFAVNAAKGMLNARDTDGEAAALKLATSIIDPFPTITRATVN